MKRPHHEMAELLGAMAHAKARWIDEVTTGRNKRSAMDIALAKRDLSALEQAAEDYRRAAKRGENENISE